MYSNLFFRQKTGEYRLKHYAQTIYEPSRILKHHIRGGNMVSEFESLPGELNAASVFVDENIQE
jgi:hypothetical protein